MNRIDKIILCLCGGHLDDPGSVKWRTVERLKTVDRILRSEEEDFAVLFSAGISGHKSPSPNVYDIEPESWSYAEWLSQRVGDRIPIYVEDMSRDTVGNIFFSFSWLAFLGFRGQLWIVTNKFHMPRVKEISAKFEHFIPNAHFKFVEVADGASGAELSLLEQQEIMSLKAFSRDIIPHSLEFKFFSHHIFYQCRRWLHRR